jgi:hypothetical protein
MTENLMADNGWVPDVCTLPTVEQPLRRAEFDDLFAQDLLGVAHESPQRVRLTLRPESSVASRAAGRAVKETGCCSFFAFTLAISDGEVSMAVEAAPAHEHVLAALAARAESKLGPSA